MTSLDSKTIFVCNVMHRSTKYIQNSSIPKTNHSGTKPSLPKRNDTVYKPYNFACPQPVS